MKVLYLSTAFPSLTMTFVYREVGRLRNAGVDVVTASMNTPPKQKISGEAEQFLADTAYLDQVPLHTKLFALLLAALRSPVRFWRCLRILFAYRPMKPGYDLPRALAHLLSAAWLARRYRGAGLDRIHSHFISGPTTIAMFLAELLDIPFSFTMHASNIWLYPGGLKTKLQRCQFAVSISEYNRNYIASEYGQELAQKIEIVHCGIDLEEFVPEPKTQSEIDTIEPPLVFSVGQFVERKGFDILVKACALLRDQGKAFRCVIIGGGPLLDEIKRQVAELGLTELVQLPGAKLQEQTRLAMQQADVFCLPCRIVEHGGRDGIPVVLMEAMALEKFTVSTNIVGIPELLRTGTNGALVAPEDPAALADAISAYLENPAAFVVQRKAARETIAAEFNIELCVDQLEALFRREAHA